MNDRSPFFLPAARAGAALLLALVAGHAAAKGTLVYCSEGSPQGFQPQFFSLGTTFDASSVPVFNRLVQFELGSTRIVPGLAQSWTISADGKTYTFKLRPGVKFHANADFKPTRDFNADDVVFSWSRMADENHPFHKLTAGETFAYYDDMGMKDIVERVEKVDDATVRFVLKSPQAPFLADLAMDFASILSKEYFETMLARGKPQAADNVPIGTGPFAFLSYQKDATIRYKAFDAYWGGRPKIDTLVYSIVRDATARYAKLKTGECHVMAYPKPADVADMQKDPALTVLKQEGLNVGYIAFNVTKKPFDNKLVRQALNLAVDKDAIIKAVYQGNGTPAKNPIPPILWGYANQVSDYPHDPQRARALLAQAGLPNGFDVDLWYLPVTRPYNPDGKRMAEMIQADWAKIGVKARLVTYEWAEYSKRAKNGEHAILMYGWSGDNGDPDNFFMPLLGCDAVKGGGNSSRWCNKEFNDLITRAATLPQQAERARLYERAQQVFHDEAPWIPIAHSVRFEPIRNEVVGYKMDVTAKHDFSGVDLK
ncbi:MAG TPA: ABC transporter substrate-binding protein [Burkholderiaceae bacterium]|nr:ABC transporter substrate-binding protein [Burkholderiaceae bacterium]